MSIKEKAKDLWDGHKEEIIVFGAYSIGIVLGATIGWCFGEASGISKTSRYYAIMAMRENQRR